MINYYTIGGWGKHHWGQRGDKIGLLKLDNGYSQRCYTILFTSVYFEIFAKKKFQFQEKKVHGQFFCHKYASHRLTGSPSPWAVSDRRLRAMGNPVQGLLRASIQSGWMERPRLTFSLPETLTGTVSLPSGARVAADTNVKSASYFSLRYLILLLSKNILPHF